MARVLIIAGDWGTASGQLQYCYYRLKEEESFEVVLASVAEGRIDTVVDMREEGWDYDTERRGYSFEADAGFGEVDPGSFDALVLPGWRATESLRNNEDCVGLVRHFVEADKPIGSIDGGVRLLLAAGVKGRRLTGTEFLGIEIARHNTYVDAGGEAVVDGNIVTATRRPYYHVWMGAFMELMRERGLVGVAA